MNINNATRSSAFVSIGGAFLMLLHYLGVTSIPWTLGMGAMMVGHIVYGPLVMYKNLKQTEDEKKEVIYLEVINLGVAIAFSVLTWFFTKEFQIAFTLFVGIALVDVCTLLLVRVIRYPLRGNCFFVAALTSIVTFAYGAITYWTFDAFKWYPYALPTVHSVIHLFSIIVIILFCLSGYAIKTWLEKAQERNE